MDVSLLHDLNVFYIMRLNKGACRVCELFICVLFCVLWYKVDVRRGVCAIWVYGVAYVMTCVYWNTSYMWRAEKEHT